MDNKDNIEKLFSEKFSDFSPEVDPSAWTNIQNGLHSGAGAGSGAAGSTGILGSKVAIISAVAVVSTVAGIVIGSQLMDSSEPQVTQRDQVSVEQTDDVNRSETTPTGGMQGLKNEIIEREEKEKQESTGKKQKEEPSHSIFVIDENENGEELDDNSVRSEAGSAAMDLANSSSYDPVPDKEENPEEETSSTSPENEEVEIVEVQEDQPYASIVASPIGGYAPLHVSFKSDANYDEVFWDFNDGSTSRDPNPAHIFYEIGTYEVSVRVTSPEGKTATDKIFIEVKKSSSIDIPNVFTPNNDGVNDRFIVVGKKIREFNMKVFDRRGKLLFETNDVNSGWNGKDLNDMESPEETYFYIISAEGEDGKQFKEKGSISLFR